MTRLEANLAILREIEMYVQEHPTQRFQQMLANMGVTQPTRPAPADGPLTLQDLYHEESGVTLRRVQERRGRRG